MCTANRGFAQGNVADTGKSKPVFKSQPFSPTTTTKVDTGTIIKKKQPWAPNPKRAGLYAALLPGLGQVYNRQYWKLPIVYGGFAIGGYFIAKNSKDYTTFRKAYVGRFTDPSGAGESEETKIFDQPQLKQLQDDANRYLNMSVLFTTIGYAMQVLDAVTAAHLRNFDISRDISMRVTPVLFPGGTGIGLAVNF